MFRDVSADYWKDRKLRESEERFRSLVEASGDLIWEVDTECRYTYVSPKIKDLLGYDPEEVLGKTPFDLMTPESAGRAATRYRQCTSDISPQRFWDGPFQRR